MAPFEQTTMQLQVKKNAWFAKVFATWILISRGIVILQRTLVQMLLKDAWGFVAHGLRSDVCAFITLWLSMSHFSACYLQPFRFKSSNHFCSLSRRIVDQAFGLIRRYRQWSRRLLMQLVKLWWFILYLRWIRWKWRPVWTKYLIKEFEPTWDCKIWGPVWKTCKMIWER